MTHSALPPSVVVHVHGSYADHGRAGAAPSSGHAPARLPADFPHAAHAAALGFGALPSRPVDNPFEVQKSMPQLWSVFIKANFSDLRAVMAAFGVSERAARKWWNGDGGVNGAYVVHALRIMPDAAQQMLIAAE